MSGRVDAAGLQAVVERIERILGDQTSRWVNTPLRALGNKTPLSVVAEPGGIEKIQEVLTRLENGVSSE